MANLGYRDGELFVAQLEQAQADGNPDHIAANLDRLVDLIAQLQDRQQELAEPNPWPSRES